MNPKPEHPQTGNTTPEQAQELLFEQTQYKRKDTHPDRSPTLEECPSVNDFDEEENGFC